MGNNSDDRELLPPLRKTLPGGAERQGHSASAQVPGGGLARPSHQPDARRQAGHEKARNRCVPQEGTAGLRRPGTSEPVPLPRGCYLGEEAWKALAEDRKGFPVQGKGERQLFLEVALLLVHILNSPNSQLDFSSMLGIPRQQELGFGKGFLFALPPSLPHVTVGTSPFYLEGNTSYGWAWTHDGPFR